MPNQRLAAILLAATAVASAALEGQEPPLWQRRIEPAMAAARSAGRLVLVDAYADWCGWCEKLEREVFPHPAFRALARDLVLLRVDVEDGGEGTELAETYGATSLPTLILLEPSGTFVGSVSGFAPAEELARRVRAEIAAHERALAAFARTLAAGDARALERAGLDRWQRRDGARAAAALEKLLSIASLPPEGEAWNRYLLADAWRLAGELERARSAAAAAERARARAGETDPELAERLALLPFWIAESARDCGAAAGRLAAFERSHPSSALLGEARRAMARLRADAGPLCA
jgi:thiol-disulfide isomerase/thioredoxin